MGKSQFKKPPSSEWSKCEHGALSGFQDILDDMPPWKGQIGEVDLREAQWVGCESPIGKVSVRFTSRSTSCFLILILSGPSRGCSRPSCSPSTRERPVEDNCTQSRMKLWSYFLLLSFFASKIFRPVCSLALPIGDWLLHRPNDPWHMLHYYFLTHVALLWQELGFRNLTWDRLPQSLELDSAIFLVHHFQMWTD